MKRRQFLLAAATAAVAAPAMSFSGKLFAAPAGMPRFLLVFLRGGYDCNNLLIPYSSDFYYESRPTLAIAKPDPQNTNSAIGLDSEWGLNPILRDSVYPLWQKKQVAFVPFAGTDDMSRSHFETQDNIESGEPTGQRTDYRSGFLARLSGSLANVPSIAFTDALPLSFQGGSKDIPNISLRGVAKPAFDERQSAILAGMYKGTSLAAAATDGLELRQKVSKDLEDEMMKANRGAATAKNFAAETQRIATMMRDQYRVGFVDVGCKVEVALTAFRDQPHALASLEPQRSTHVGVIKRRGLGHGHISSITTLRTNRFRLMKRVRKIQKCRLAAAQALLMFCTAMSTKLAI